MEVEIKKEYKTPSGVYVLFGEEDYLKRFYAAKIREALLGDSPYALFNHVIFTPKNFTADERTLAHLVDVAGSDMSALAGEIEKLCVYLHAVGRDTLTAADIDLVTAATKELEPFALSGAVLDGDTDRALSILRTMEEKRVRPFSAFAGIYSTYIDLYRVRACLDAGLPVGEIAKKLKMHEYRTKLYAAAAKKTTSARLGVVLSLCREADLAIKSESSDYGRLRALVCEAAR